MTVFGIDLGTSNSSISFWDGEKVQLVPNQHGERLTPSVISLDETGEVLIGKIAKERLLTHPERTVSTFKRFMGTKKSYKIGDTSFTPVELSSLILTSLKNSAEQFLNEPCEEAVISVPAYFNTIQREVTMEAAKLAGLTVTNLISEPTAAAVAYGLTKKEDQMILVLDLGGGTFDVSLLDLFEGVMQVEATAGDNYLGGEDFTQVLIQDFYEKNQIETSTLSLQEQGKVYQKMEQAKRELGQDNAVNVCLELNQKEYTYQLTPSEYEQLLEQLLHRMKLPISRVLKDSDVTLAEIDQVILVGGATRLNLVRRYFAKLLKVFPNSHLNPDEVVTLGAAIHAELKQETIKKELILTDVSAYSLGVDAVRQTENGYINDVFVPIIERNTTIPASKMNYFYTVVENQRKMAFIVYQGENAKASENLKVGEIVIDLPKRTPKDYPVACRFTYDNNGIIEVILEDEKNGHKEKLIIEENPGSLTPEEIQASLEKLAALKILPEDQAENRMLVARVERLYSEMLGNRREQIQGLLFDFQAILKTQDRKLIQQRYRELSKIVDELERDIWL